MKSFPMFYLISFCFIFALSAYAENSSGSICGIVTYYNTNDGLPNVLVSVDTGNEILTTYTDFYGHYCLNDLYPAYYTVSFKSYDHEKIKEMISLNEELNIALCPGIEKFYILTESQLIASENTTFFQQIELAGGCPVSYSYSGELPDGLTFDQSTGVISGHINEDQEERFTFTVSVVDLEDNVTSKDFLLIILKKLSISTEGCLDCVVVNEPF
ncbi:putative Ig, partial [Candidatus Magnetomorum sp. HK-1]